MSKVAAAILCITLMVAVAVPLQTASANGGPPAYNEVRVKAPGKTAQDLLASIAADLNIATDLLTVTADSSVGVDGFLIVFSGEQQEIYAQELDFKSISVLLGMGITWINNRELATPSPNAPPPTTEQPAPLTYFERIRQIESTVMSMATPLSPLPSNCTAAWLVSREETILKAQQTSATYTITFAITQFGLHYGYLMDPIPYNVTTLVAEATWATGFFNQANWSAYSPQIISQAEQTEQSFFALRATLAIAATVNTTRWCYVGGESFPTSTNAPMTMPPIQVDTALYQSLELGIVKSPKDGQSGCPSWVFSPPSYADHVAYVTDDKIISDYYIVFGSYLPANFVSVWQAWSLSTNYFYSLNSPPTSQQQANAPTYSLVKTAVEKFRQTLYVMEVQNNYSHCFDMSTTPPPGFQEPIHGNSTLALYSQILYRNSRLRTSPIPASCPTFIKEFEFHYYMQESTAVKDKSDAQIVSEYWQKFGSYFPEVLNQTLFLELVLIGKAAIAHPPGGISDSWGSSLPIWSGDGESGTLPSDFPLSVDSTFTSGTPPPLPSGPSENIDPSQLGSGSWLPFASGSGEGGSQPQAPAPPPSRLELGQNAVASLSVMRQTLGWNDTVGAYPACFNQTVLTLPPEPTDPPGLSSLTLDVQRYINYQATLFREFLTEVPPGSGCPSWVTHETFVNDYVTNAYLSYPASAVIETYALLLEPKVVALYGGTPFDVPNLKAWEVETARFFTTGEGNTNDMDTFTKVQEIVGIFRNTLGQYNLTVLEYPQCFGAQVTEPPQTYEPGSGDGKIGQTTNAILSRMYEVLTSVTRSLVIPLPAVPTCPTWMQDSTTYKSYYDEGKFIENYNDDQVITTYVAKYTAYFGQTGLNETKLKADNVAGKSIIANGGTGIAGVTDMSSMGSMPDQGSLGSQTHPSVIPSSALEAVAQVKVMKQTLSMVNSRDTYPACFSNETGAGALLPQWHPDTVAYGLVNQQYNREVKQGVSGCPSLITNSTQLDDYLATGDERMSDADCISQYSQKFAPGLTAQSATIPVTAAIQWNEAALKYYNGSAFSANEGFLADKYHLVRESVQLFHLGLARADLYENYPQCFGAIITGAPTLAPDFGNSGTVDPNGEYMIVVLNGEMKSAASPVPPTCPNWFQSSATFDAMMQSGNVSSTLTDTQAVTLYLDTWGGGLPVNITVSTFISKLNAAREYAAANPNAGLGAQSLPSGASLGLGSGLGASLPGFSLGSQGGSFSGSTLPGFSLGSLPPISGSTSNGGSMPLNQQQEEEFVQSLTAMSTIRQTVGWKVAKENYPSCFDLAIPTFATGTTVPPTSTGTNAPVVTGTTQAVITTTSAPTTAIPSTPIPATPAPPTPVGQTPVPATPAPPTPVGQTPVPATPAPPTPVGQTPVPATPAPPTPVGQTPVPGTPVPPSPAPPTPAATPVPPTPTPATTTNTPATTTSTPAPPTGATTTVATTVFKATLKPGKTKEQFEKNLQDTYPNSTFIVTQTGTNADGQAQVEFEFTGAQAGVEAQQMDTKKGALASTLELSTLSSANDSTAAPTEEGSNTALIVGAVVGGLVVVLILVGIVVKVATGGDKGTAQHTDYHPHEDNSNLNEELVHRESSNGFGEV